MGCWKAGLVALAVVRVAAAFVEQCVLDDRDVFEEGACWGNYRIFADAGTLDVDARASQDAPQPAVADVDGDGHDEVFLGDTDGVRLIYNATAARPREVFVDLAPWADGEVVCPATWDVDGDGDADLLAASPTGSVVVVENLGNAAYGPVFEVLAAGVYCDDTTKIAAGELVDGDGAFELLMVCNVGDGWELSLFAVAYAAPANLTALAYAETGAYEE